MFLQPKHSKTGFVMLHCGWYVQINDDRFHPVLSPGYWRPELPAKALAKGLKMEPIYALCIIRQTPSGEWEGSSGAVNTEGSQTSFIDKYHPHCNNKNLQSLSLMIQMFSYFL